MTPRLPAALASGLLTLATFGTAACSATVPASQILGRNVGDIIVLADPPVVPGVRCAMAGYVLGKPRGIKFGTAAPAAIAAAVKEGEPADLVILPTGSALDRVRDELATPPTRIVTPHPGTTWWAAAVTDKGLRLVRFLSSRQGRSLLESTRCTVSANGQAP